MVVVVANEGEQGDCILYTPTPRFTSRGSSPKTVLESEEVLEWLKPKHNRHQHSFVPASLRLRQRVRDEREGHTANRLQGVQSTRFEGRLYLRSNHLTVRFPPRFAWTRTRMDRHALTEDFLSCIYKSKIHCSYYCRLIIELPSDLVWKGGGKPSEYQENGKFSHGGERFANSKSFESIVLRNLHRHQTQNSPVQMLF